jgi:Mu-like prophage protein gp36
MYCAPDELKDYLFHKYLAKIEELEPGLVQRHIDSACALIDDMLRPRFRLPLPNPPETIRRIARVISAYRCVGAITTMMSTESNSANEWIPLQTQYKEVMRQLEDIAVGKMDVGLEALGNEPEDLASEILTHSRKPLFGDAFWSKY